MNKKKWVWAFAALGLAFSAGAAAADIYQAAEAFEKKDLERAFTIYKELAELGHPEAQENVAVMYVNGEGVKRDNVLGYAWAQIAIQSGASGEAAKGIVSQLEPHIKPASRDRIAAVSAEFGREALQKKMLPIKYQQPIQIGDARCLMKAPADPYLFYPEGAKAKHIQGNAFVEAYAGVDGSVRNPRVWYTFPVGVFDQSARAVALLSKYSNERTDEQLCRVLFKVKYVVQPPSNALGDEVKQLKPLAVQGDPKAQVTYAILLDTFSELNKDNEDTRAYALKAAQAGLPSAQYLVGTFLNSGSGFEKDLDKAKFWFEKAAAAGNEGSMISLANYELRKKDDPAARARGVEWLAKATHGKNWLAQFYYASLLASEPSAPWHDPQRALTLLKELNGGFDYDPASFEIRAAANAALGNFDDAKSSQTRALRDARRIGWKLDALEARLALYEQGKTWSGDLIEF